MFQQDFGDLTVNDSLQITNIKMAYSQPEGSVSEAAFTGQTATAGGTSAQYYITSGDAIGQGNTTLYSWWTDYYYPNVIRTMYPVYIQERARDEGMKAYQIVKHLKDKGLVTINTAKQFIELMDALIKML